MPLTWRQDIYNRAKADVLGSQLAPVADQFDALKREQDRQQREAERQQQQAAEQQALAASSIPTLESLLSSLGLSAPAQPATTPPVAPSGTPSAMPTAPPRTLPSTGEQIGDITIEDGRQSAGPPRGGDLRAYTRQKAQQLGIDPDIAERVAGEGEGGFDDPVRQSDVVYQGEREQSYGPFQMNVTGGLGTRMIQERGRDPRNPAHVYDAIDYALEHAARNGWGAFHGAARIGIGEWDGIGSSGRQVAPPSSGVAPIASTQANPSSTGQGDTPSSGEAFAAGSWTPNQYNAAKAEGLDDETAWAVCGPAAAIAFARRNGRNPTMQEALGLAKRVGWTVEQGMAGPASQQKLLQEMGIAARLVEGAPDWQAVAADVQRGNPVTISTPGHYFVAERYNPQDGTFDFGNSAAILKASGGRRWFRPDELASLGMGDARAALFLDAPQSPAPSAVAGRTAPNVGASPSPAASPSAASDSPAYPPAPWESEAVQSQPNAPGDTMYRQGFGLPADEPMAGAEQPIYPGEDAPAPAYTPPAPYDPYQDGYADGYTAPDAAREVEGSNPSHGFARGSSTGERPLPASYEISDGRTAPPTPQGDWQPLQTQPTAPLEGDDPGERVAGTTVYGPPDPWQQVNPLEPGTLRPGDLPGQGRPLPPGRIDVPGPPIQGSGHGLQLPPAVQDQVIPRSAQTAPVPPQEQSPQQPVTLPLAPAQPAPATPPPPSRVMMDPSVRSGERTPAEVAEEIAASGTPGTPRLPGRIGNRVTNLVEEARRSQSDQMDPLEILDIVGGVLPTTVVNAILTAQTSEGRWKEISGTDPLAPFRPAAARYGVPLPSPEEANPEGFPAVSIWAGLLAALGIPDPSDPVVGAALRTVGRSARAGGLPLAAGAAGAVYGAATAPEGSSLGQVGDRALAYGAGGAVLGATPRAAQNPTVRAAGSRIREGWEEGRATAARMNAADNGRPGTLGTMGVSPGASHRQTEPAPIFYSQLRRTIEEKMPNRASPQQVQGILKSGQVKPDEIAWTGIDDWLAENRGRPVTKQEVLDYLDQNEVWVEEIVKGGVNDVPSLDELKWERALDETEDAERWRQEIDPDGYWSDDEFYAMSHEDRAREHLDAAADDIDAWARQTRDELLEEFPDSTKYSQYTLPGGENYRELLLTLPNRQGVDAYQSSHWDEPNIVAHVRFNEHTASDGKRVLLIEEIQSDWHQAGRREGYTQAPPDQTSIARLREEGQQIQRQIRELETTHPDVVAAKAAVDEARTAAFAPGSDIRATGKRLDAAQRTLRETVTRVTQPLEDRLAQLRTQTGAIVSPNTVPPAPFEKTWPELAAKRMLRYAAENGYDRLSWAPGRVHAQRYGTERIAWERTPDGGWEVVVKAQVGGQAPGVVDLGAEATARGLIDEGKPFVVHSLDDLKRALRGIRGIDHPGRREIAENRTLAERTWKRMQESESGIFQPRAEGLVGYYDNSLRNTIAKLGKKFNARVNTVDVRTAQGQTEAAHVIDITPEMRESVLGQGQPLFATPGITSRAGSQLLTDASNSLGGGVFGAAAGQASDPYADDETRARNAASGFAAGAILGPAAGRLMRRGQGGALGTFGFGGRPANQSAAATPNPVIQRMAQQMAATTVPTGPQNRRGLLERWAQAMTDDRAGLRNLQESVSRAIGRPLQPGEMVAELTRRNPASVAGQRLQDELRPALVRVGDDDDYLAQYLVHSHNIDVAREIGQRAYDAAIKAGQSPAVASRRAMAASNARQFSGDLRLSETQQALTDIEARVKSLPDGDTRWAAITDAADAIWALNRKTLERKRDAGIISDAFLTELSQRYPRYVRTDIADYFDKGPGGPGGGNKRVGLSDIGIQKIGDAGTTKDRVNPLYSTIEQTYAAESAIVRNEAGKAFEELLRLDPTWQSTFKEVVPAQGVNRGNPATTVPSSYTLRNGEQFLRVWDGGTERTFVIPKAYAALVSPQAGRVLGDNVAANGWRTMMNVYKSLITSKNPAFSFIVSPLRDVGDYMIREGAASTQRGGILGAIEGGGRALGALADYARAVPDAFAGILEGTYKGDLARMMAEGAGQGSRPGHDLKELRSALADLKRTNGLEVRNVGDLMRIAGNVLTLGAEPIGGRLEQVPRLAAARRAAQRGAPDLEQTMAFRDATVDFQRAGEWSRVINELVPFFNVAMQGGAQVVRTVRQNPAAAIGATAATIGTGALAAEAWNRSDEGRASDYDDVPDYLRKTGIVVMLPGVEGQSERGDRLPNYLWIPVGVYGALLQTAKEAAVKTAEGGSGADLGTASGWAELLNEIGGIFSPLRGESAGAVATSLIPPGLSTAADLAADRDLYRGSKIATEPRDENASALSQGSAGLFNRLTGQETRPSQWEHLYRDLGGYGATLGLAASNMAAEAVGLRNPKEEDRPIQNAPVVGGLVNRIVRDAGGQRMEEARADDARVPEDIRPILEEVGLRRDEVTAVGSRYRGAQLTREEQERWQELTNNLVVREVRAARRSSEWRERGADKAKLVSEAITRAKQQAAERALRRLDEREIERRKGREERRKAS